MRRSTGQTWLVCAVIGIGMFALSSPSVFDRNSEPETALLTPGEPYPQVSDSSLPSSPSPDDAATEMAPAGEGIAEKRGEKSIVASAEPPVAGENSGKEAAPAKNTEAPIAAAARAVLSALAPSLQSAIDSTVDSTVDSTGSETGAKSTETAAITPIVLPTEKPAVSEIYPREHTVRVGKGQTLSAILIKAGVPPLEVDATIAAVKKVYNPRRLLAGQEITITFGPPLNGKRKASFQGFEMAVGFDRRIGARRNERGGFSSLDIRKELETKLTRVNGTIRHNLAKAAISRGVPKEVLAEMVGVFSFDVDFQRDIQVNDSFEVMYESLYDDEGDMVHTGNVVFTALTLSGMRMPLYRYESQKGGIDFYNEKGESVHKALLRTPVDGARLSSRFGKRKHPILGYTKMHRGVDFAAPGGTPIKAAGDGVIDAAGRNGAYGHYVRIRHNSEYSTAYAHLKRYRKGIRSGKRVKQGDIIGYVGSSGRSTGPHLHFEVMRRGNRINPLSIKLPSGKKLTGEDLLKFKSVVENIKSKYAQLPTTRKVASTQ